jgi:hypothetical protein
VAKKKGFIGLRRVLPKIFLCPFFIFFSLSFV